MAREETSHSITLSAHERLDNGSASVLSDQELLTILLGPSKGSNNLHKAAAALLETAPLAEMAWATPQQLEQIPGIGPTRAASLAAAFELGRRVAWKKPARGDRCLDPERVYELFRDVAFSPTEQFWILCLDVRGHVIKRVHIATGSLSQCPVEVRQVLTEAIRCAAHGVVFVHSHPSGDPSPSVDDNSLTERLRAASELVGVMARDHVIVAGGGWFSYVHAGLWRR